MKDRNKTILVVDDEPQVRHLLTGFIRHMQWQSVAGPDVRTALQLLADHQVDLVISDMDMPDASGLDLLGQLSQRRPQVPVIMLTGRPGVEAAVECMRYGALDYLTKPCDLDRLEKLIRQAFEHQQMASSGTEILTPQRVIAGYQIERTIGEGAMGVVFQAQKNGRRYALKILRDSSTDEHERMERHERFKREAEAAAELEHPNIVKIHDFGIAGEQKIPYIAMEYVAGRSLKYVMEHAGNLDYNAKAMIIQQVAWALDAIHAAGLCHRDIKPGNIIVDEELRTKLTDFGIVRLPNSELTRAGQVLGSPAYMSPEAFCSIRTDARADIFSLGVVAYELLLERKPFFGENLVELASAISKKEPPAPRQLDANFPRPLQRVLRQMLRKQPDKRCQSAAAVATALDAAMRPRSRCQSLLDVFSCRW